jgi:tRNA threonylcarbamoyl adenosine modification protein YeaZ
MNRNKVLVAIESAISGGSIAIFSNHELLASFAGESGVSRAEDLLPNLDTLLRDNGVTKGEIEKIAVSVGPGSFTGLRIGISSVLGLKAAFGIECVGVKLFAAIQSLDYEAAIAIPLGKHDICLRRSKDDELLAVPIADLASSLDGLENVLAHHDIIETLNAAGIESLTNIGRDLAVHIGRFAADHTASAHLEPIYIQSPRFV